MRLLPRSYRGSINAIVYVGGVEISAPLKKGFLTSTKTNAIPLTGWWATDEFACSNLNCLPFEWLLKAIVLDSQTDKQCR